MPSDKLSAKELIITTLICKGLPNKAIADKLNLSFKTIVNYRARIYTKLNVHCTADLIRKAVKMKLISMEEV